MASPSLAERARLATAALPTGTIPVGLGLIVNGASTYAFQILAFRELGSASYAALNGLWVTAFVLAPGLFLPLEQEIGRALAHRRSHGEGGRPLLAKALVAALVLVIAVIALVLLLRGPIETRLLRSSDGLFAALVVVLVGFAVESLARGTLSGNERFGRYGVIVGVDGFARAVFAALIALVGVGTLGWYGAVFAVGPFIAVVCGLVGARGLAEPGPKAAMSELTTAIGWLLLGSTFAQALGYSAYIGASVLATPAQNAALGAFIAGLFIARVPILLFQAVQAALLPKLAALLAQRRIAEFRHGLLRLVWIVAVGGLLATAAGYLLGPFVGGKLFGASYTLDAIGLASLIAGCCAIVVALTIAQALIALQRYAVTALAWVFALAVFVAVMALLADWNVFTRAEIAFVVGAAAAIAWIAVAAWRSLPTAPAGD